MPEDFERHFLSSADEEVSKVKIYQSVLLTATIMLTLMYSWLFAHELEPNLRAPEAVVSGVGWFEQGHLYDWREVRLTHAREVTQIASSLWELDANFAATGGFDSPPELVIDADQKSVFVVSDSQIRISSDLATARGVLGRALIQCWLLQRAGLAATASLLRLEVISDSLASMLLGRTGFDLGGAKIGSQTVELPLVKNWLEFAQSAARYCQSEWRSLRLGARSSACLGSDGIMELSFRPLLDAMVWNVFESVPHLDRLEFIASWSKSLRDLAPPGPKFTSDGEKSPTQWREELNQEFRMLFANLRSSRERASSEQVLLSARLGPHQMPEVPLALIRSGSDSVYLQPGSVHLAASDSTQLHVGALAWQNCRPTELTTVGQIMKLKVPTKKILYIESCDEISQQTWKDLNRFGAESFELLEPKLPFMILNRLSLELAVKREQFDLRAPLNTYMTTRPPRGASLLGLESAKTAKGSYRVFGAIEAIEAFRELKASSASTL